MPELYTKNTLFLHKKYRNIFWGRVFGLFLRPFPQWGGDIYAPNCIPQVPPTFRSWLRHWGFISTWCDETRLNRIKTIRDGCHTETWRSKPVNKFFFNASHRVLARSQEVLNVCLLLLLFCQAIHCRQPNFPGCQHTDRKVKSIRWCNICWKSNCILSAAETYFWNRFLTVYWTLAYRPIRQGKINVKAFVIHKARFLSLQPDISLHCQTTDTRGVPV